MAHQHGTLVLRRAKIHRFDGDDAAEAIALHGGLILAVGSERAVWNAVGSDTPSVDLGGRVVLPGLCDAHLHWGAVAMAKRRLHLDTSDSLGQVLRKVRQSAEDGGGWVLGRGWDHQGWGRWPNTADLDAACPDRPAALTRKDGHVTWVNSAALAAAGIDAQTPDPAGGEIDKGDDGLPTGILKENAKELVRAAIPPVTAHERQSALIEAWPEAWSRGLTSAHDMGMDGRSLFRDLSTLRDAGELGLRFVWTVQRDELDEAIGLGLRSGLGDEWLRLGGLKLFLDGTLGSQTADMLEPYEGQPFNRGLPTLDFEVFRELSTRAAASGLATAVHAIGDAANRKALDGFQSIIEAVPNASQLRQRIEHAQLLAKEDVARFASLGVVASMQPLHATADMAVAESYWGSRCELAYAWRSLLNAGAHLAFGSDAPIEALDVFAGVHAAVTRSLRDGTPQGGWEPRQRIAVREALEAYTTGAAYAGGTEDMLGSLTPGKRADLIVLDKDPLEIAPQNLPQLRVLATMIEGIWVWQATDVDLAGPRQES